MQVTKIPALKCPQCGSIEVSPGFAQKVYAKKVGLVFVRDHRIYCYACRQVTDTLSNRVDTHNYSSNKIIEDYYDDGPYLTVQPLDSEEE